MGTHLNEFRLEKGERDVGRWVREACGTSYEARTSRHRGRASPWLARRASDSRWSSIEGRRPSGFAPTAAPAIAGAEERGMRPAFSTDRREAQGLRLGQAGRSHRDSARLARVAQSIRLSPVEYRRGRYCSSSAPDARFDHFTATGGRLLVAIPAHRRNFGVSNPNRSSTRPTVWSIKSSIVFGLL